VRSRAARLVNAARGAPPAAPPVEPLPPPVAGMVEQFSRRLVVGWISVPADTPPVAVALYLGKLKVSTTFATVGASMSGVTSVLRSGRDGSSLVPVQGPQLVHSWQQPNIAGPADDRRNSRRQIRTFSFRVRDIWPYVKRSTRITVRVHGRPLPIYGHGMYLSPPKSGKRSVAELRDLLRSGHVLSHYGILQLSKKLDGEWQARAIDLYDRVRGILATEWGFELFLIYGTLLGVVREGGYIGHDVDFDAAYVSQRTTGEEAAQELAEIGLALVEHGLSVDPETTALHVFDPDNRSVRIDVFHTYFDSDGVMRFPFGVAGTSRVTRADWLGTTEVTFNGGSGLAPVNAEQIVEHLYGEDWRRPKPGFNWNLDRTDRAVEGELTPSLRSRVYWADFYAHMEYTEGSTFFEFVHARPETPDMVFEIGCGDGRDSCAFGLSGRRVMAVDQSPTAVEHARRHADELGVRARVQFEICDVSDHDRLRALMDGALADERGPVMFYMRFFLHSITQELQDDLLDVLAERARPGDLLAAEFRTVEDEGRTKVHGGHYRRFQSAEGFRCELTSRGFAVTYHHEGTGLSPYRGEDPALCRVVARR
jgi:hypothetical protein